MQKVKCVKDWNKKKGIENVERTCKKEHVRNGLK